MISQLSNTPGPAMHFILLLFSNSTLPNTATTITMELVITDLQSQEKPNYKATAKKYGVNNMTFRHRFLGEQLSPTAPALLYRQYLPAV